MFYNVFIYSYSNEQIMKALEPSKINEVGVNPGLTNLSFLEDYYGLLKEKEKNLTGMERQFMELYEQGLFIGDELRNENNIPNEGTVFFDSITRILRPIDPKDKKKGFRQVIINLELEKDLSGIKKIFDDSVYYAGRLISSSKWRSFLNSKTEDMEEVISIWICLNLKKECIINIAFRAQTDYGDQTLAQAFVSPYNIYIVSTGEASSKEPSNKLLKLIRLIFIEKMPVEKKCEILEKEYDFKISEERKENLEEMSGFIDMIREDQKRIDREEMNGFIENIREDQRRIDQEELDQKNKEINQWEQLVIELIKHNSKLSKVDRDNILEQLLNLNISSVKVQEILENYPY